MPKPEPPAELCDEIISYLWNDTQSLKSCSLANKAMVVPCQRRLFHRIVLRSPREQTHFYYTNGTSANLSKLLTESPHIAGYVRSLFIYDHIAFIYDALPCESIDPLDAPMVAFTESEEDYRRRQWLPQDKYLPDFAPLLCNLRALMISYIGQWKHLSFRVFSSLVHIMQLPSLLYVRLQQSYPDCIFDLAMGENVKHLFVDGYHEEPLPVHQLSHPASGPLCIESLFTSSFEFLKSLLQSTPTRRINTRCLRRVVLQLTSEGPVTQAFLESCDALEDLKVIVDTRDSSYPVIRLDKLTTMTKFTASLGFPRRDRTLKTNMPWLRRELLSGSTLANQALREVTIEVACYYGKDYYSISEWKEIFGTLDQYSNLTILNITIGSHSVCGEAACEKLFDLLDTCDDVGRLRTLKNVDVRVCKDSDFGERAVDWTPWKNI